MPSQQAQPADAGPNSAPDWSVPCHDTAGRLRSLVVIKRRTGLVLVAPAGESAHLDQAALRELIVHLATETAHLIPSNQRLPLGS